MVLLEEYSEKYGELYVTVGPVFDYDYDGVGDTMELIQDKAM